LARAAGEDLPTSGIEYVGIECAKTLHLPRYRVSPGWAWLNFWFLPAGQVEIWLSCSKCRVPSPEFWMAIVFAVRYSNVN